MTKKLKTDLRSIIIILDLSEAIEIAIETKL